MKLKPRYTLTVLLAAILVIGLPLAWVRHKLDERAAYREQLAELPEKGILVTYHAGLPQHPWYAFFEGVQNPEQAQKIVMSGPQIGDDDLRQFDAFPHVEEIQLAFTNVTDEGLLHLVRQHRRLTKIRVQACDKITKEAIAKVRASRLQVLVEDWN